jgi:DNA-binding transcriptional regulator YdaS (Cro superfamily)
LTPFEFCAYRFAMTHDMHKQAIKKAGGPKALAAHLNITPEAVSQWRRVPIDRVHAVARITGIPAKKLRPDIFTPDKLT